MLQRCVYHKAKCRGRLFTVPNDPHSITAKMLVTHCRCFRTNVSDCVLVRVAATVRNFVVCCGHFETMIRIDGNVSIAKRRNTVSSRKAYDMVGNAREWPLNEVSCSKCAFVCEWSGVLCIFLFKFDIAASSWYRTLASKLVCLQDIVYE